MKIYVVGLLFSFFSISSFAGKVSDGINPNGASGSYSPSEISENGGGLFLITYFLCVIVIGIPVLIGELLIGRHSQRAAIGAGILKSSKKCYSSHA